MKLSTLASAAGVLALATAFAASAHAAENTVSVEVGGAHAMFEDSGEDIGTNVLQARANLQFHPNFGAELEAGAGIGSDNVNGVHVSQKWEVGAFGVGYLPINDSFDLLGRVGYVNTKIQVKVAGVKADDTFDGPAAGVGLRYFPAAGADGIRADYTHYFFDDQDADVLTVSYVHKF